MAGANLHKAVPTDPRWLTRNPITDTSREEAPNATRLSKLIPSNRMLRDGWRPNVTKNHIEGINLRQHAVGHGPIKQPSIKPSKPARHVS